jgi:hypothetical protein
MDNWWIEYSWSVVAAIVGGVLGALIWEGYRNSDFAVRFSAASVRRRIESLQFRLAVFEMAVKYHNRLLGRMITNAVLSIIYFMAAMSLLIMATISTLIICNVKVECAVFSKEWLYLVGFVIMEAASLSHILRLGSESFTHLYANALRERIEHLRRHHITR